ncbi:hypothetical protein BJX68DRAFT_219288 [Aspergillus pseudodeflectus]|uniref:Uncharacterized protein n=1 Tax=Aspergillus pseudodeflectus TaxID=176178 RepID=A0ABR4JCE0_9EURO
MAREFRIKPSRISGLSNKHDWPASQPPAKCETPAASLSLRHQTIPLRRRLLASHITLIYLTWFLFLPPLTLFIFFRHSQTYPAIFVILSICRFGRLIHHLLPRVLSVSIPPCLIDKHRSSRLDVGYYLAFRSIARIGRSGQRASGIGHRSDSPDISIS